MIFEYNEQAVFTASVDVVDIGNTALRASNDHGAEYYIVIKTELGKTGILKFGPILPDFEQLLDGFNISYQKIDYKEAAISKNISAFINDYKKNIVNVEEITDIEAIGCIPDLATGFMNM